MEIPVWIKAIFAWEYSPGSEKEFYGEIQEWCKATGRYKDFESFFRSLKGKTRSATPGKGRVHSINNFSKGDYINCNGLATISAIKGALDFKKSFEVVIEYEGGMDPETGETREFRSHVFLSDGRKNYGGPAGLKEVEEHREKVLVLLYMLGDAYVLWHSGEREKAREIAVKVEEQMEKEGIKSQYIERRINETSSNF